MSEPEVVMHSPQTPEAWAAYYTECLALDISEELFRLLKEQGKTRRWLEDQVYPRSIEIDEVTHLESVARIFLALGYHLEVRAVKNKEADCGQLPLHL